MPLQTIPDSSIQYALICFGADGHERTDDPDGLNGRMSARVLELAAAAPPTNVFLFSHGWMGDVPAAIRQYDLWIGALMRSTGDVQRAAEIFPGFRPMLIGLHWPSLPWGEEEIGGGDTFCDTELPDSEMLHAAYIERLGDTPEIRSALDVIFREAVENSVPQHLSAPLKNAFLDLNQSLGLGSNGLAAPPDADRPPFDPEAALQSGSEVSFGPGGAVFSGVLGILRLCSYWKMKNRARAIGEEGMNAFVNDLQRATAPKTKVHLMGHSFGTIVISSILGGLKCNGTLQRPIDSVFLAQGAVSLWSYAEAIPADFGGGTGYFHKVIADGKVRGPLVTTQSEYDLAVGVQYPRACLVSGSPAFALADYPEYGGVGTFGFQGLSEMIKQDSEMQPADGKYNFERGKLYNLESSKYICKGDGSSGAHSDIAGPEVAHAIWAAAFAGA
jgi:hypothetical protein